MGHFDIFAKFMEMFPCYMEKVKAWKPHGNKCVAIETTGSQWLVFTFFNDREWELVSTNTRVRRV